jgi:hypothetical protein
VLEARRKFRGNGVGVLFVVGVLCLDFGGGKNEGFAGNGAHFDNEMER